jgi:GYF domain 2
MGIRFLCPTCGHRLNVKGFLAGKRGVCPQCGAGLDIPLESQIKQDASGKGSEEASDPADLIKSSSPVVGVVQLADPQATSDTDEPWLAMPVFTGAGASPIDVYSSPVAKPESAKATAGGAAPLPAVPVKPAGPSPSPRPTPATVLVQPAVPMPVPVTLPPAGSAQPTVPMAALVTASVSVPVVAAPCDPIEESPEAIWYVRPPSGGQYGPARGDIMRKWVGEGRVSQDSLVWREGWNDWRTAGQVFPGLGLAATPPPPVPLVSAAYAPTAARPSSARPAYPSRRRSSLALAVATVTVLTLMSVALLIVLFIVISRS